MEPYIYIYIYSYRPEASEHVKHVTTVIAHNVKILFYVPDISSKHELYTRSALE